MESASAYDRPRSVYLEVVIARSPKTSSKKPKASAPPAPPANPAKEFALAIARLAQDSNLKDVTILDVGPLTSIADYFVIATGTSARQMQSVCDDAAELGLKMNYKARRTSGYGGEHWIVMDFADVVLHLFNAEARSYYDLENLWGDAPRVELEGK